MRVTVIAVIFALPLTSAAQGKSSIGIDVLDQVGAVIAGAEVIVHQDGSGAGTPDPSLKLADQTLFTDSLGHAHVSAPDGFFDVCVMSSAFTPSCKKVEVRGHDATVRFKLRVDPVMEKVLGDRVE